MKRKKLLRRLWPKTRKRARGLRPDDVIRCLNRAGRPFNGNPSATLDTLVSSVPSAGHKHFLGSHGLVELRYLFNAAFYSTAFASQYGHGADRAESDPLWFAHYLMHGWRDGLRPTPLFHERWYRESCERCHIEPIGDCNPWLHWFYIGRAHGIVPTPLFDSRHYLDVHPDIGERFVGPPFEHYLNTGVKEAGRSPSIHFNPVHYKRQAEPLQQASPLIDYACRGHLLGLEPVPGLDVERFTTDNTWISTPAENAAIHLRRLHDRLESDTLATLIEEATTLEPQIPRPYGPRLLRCPPLQHPRTTLWRQARRMRQALRKTHYPSVILIPHCRMAGSARIAGVLAEAIASLGDPADVLVVTTDLSIFERADWFPDGVDVFDFNAHFDGAVQDARTSGLLDLVRGLRPERLINVNANLGWHLTTHYARQLSEWMSLYVYLFCWDRDYKGNKGGYPIQWLLPTLDYLDGVFTDCDALRQELVHRYLPSEQDGQRIVTLYTPATDREVDYGNAREQVAHRRALAAEPASVKPPRVLWCGRFDRQKRLDILLSIAVAMPEVDFEVWGKPVMDDEVDPFAHAPENLHVMGEYTCIDALPLSDYSAFLYTSGWDGLPTVLIEIGSRSIPVVASAVGGVGELVNPDTGWPIEDVENIDAYVQALHVAIDEPDRASDKARRLRTHTLALCSEPRYVDTLQAVLEREPSCRTRNTSAPGPHSASCRLPLPRAQHMPTIECEILSAIPLAVPVDAPTVDVSAILTVHGEGALAGLSYRSFETACRMAEASGMTVERIVMLDNPTRATARVFAGLEGRIRCIETAHADQGLVRNQAVRQGSGKYVAFLDGDDLWSSNWLAEACRFLENDDRSVIAHPAFCRFFSGVSSIYINIDQDDPDFQIEFLRHANYWDALCMAPRAIHLQLPYCRRRISDGFALEDWHWNCETITAGHVHKIVPDTIHFKRRRVNSQTIIASSSRSLMPPSRLTDFSDPLAIEAGGDSVDGNVESGRLAVDSALESPRKVA